MLAWKVSKTRVTTMKLKTPNLIAVGWGEARALVHISEFSSIGKLDAGKANWLNPVYPTLRSYHRARQSSQCTGSCIVIKFRPGKTCLFTILACLRPHGMTEQAKFRRGWEGSQLSSGTCKSKGSAKAGWRQALSQLLDSQLRAIGVWSGISHRQDALQYG